ncbi:MAG TPA: hypothetical protein VK985_09530 [Rariglobus sp.]|nr:hypothetical protein [Rariglobus sp.]
MRRDIENPEGKARGDSVLKTLPDALQEELYQFLRRNTQAKTLAWLQETHGIQIKSGATLTEFWTWYPKSNFLRQAAQTSDELAETLTKLPELKITAEQAREVAAASFEIAAARNRDIDTFALLGAGEDKRFKRQLAREKFEWSKKTEAEKGLEALHAEIKGDAVALQIFEQLRARVKLIQEGKV